jgi:putative transposase
VSDTSHRRDDERALMLALFRYGVIAPLVEPECHSPGDVTRLVREVASQTHYRPGEGPVRVGERTVYAWAKAYREGGIEALRPAQRKDKGRPRVLSEAVLKRAIALRKEQPKRWTKTLLDILRLEERLDGQPGFHRATLERHIERAGASRRQLHMHGSEPTIKMAFAYFGDLWVGDYHHGPLVLAPDGRPTTAKLGAFLDHCTRYPVAHRYYLAEDLATLRDTLLRALLRFGAATRVYVDRGAVYRAEQLAYSLHQVGCHLIHSRAYYSQGRGVIERWWQLAGAFEDEVRARPELLTLHELNALWEAFCHQRYLTVVHSELGRTPAEAIAEIEPRPIDPEVARRLFLVRADRSVHKKDGCVAVEGRRFLCDGSLRGRHVQVRYDPRDLGQVEIFLQGERLQTAYPQPLNARPGTHPEPQSGPAAASVDYLALLRADYDKKLLEHARPLAYADLHLEARFDLERFLEVVQKLAGLGLGEAERQELASFWSTLGPLPEDLVRIGVEHAVRLHGRNRHVRVYLHAVRTLVLAHWRGAPHTESR